MTLPRSFLIILILITLSAFPVSGNSSPTDSAAQYNHAGELYKAGSFVQALEIYETLITSGIENPELYYNASNAAYRSKQLGKAILYIERALALDPSDEDARANRVFLNSVKMDQEPENGNFLGAFISRHFETLDPDSAAFWSGIAFLIALLAATLALFVRGTKRSIVILCVAVFLLVSFLSGSISIQKIRSGKNQTAAIIMTDEAKAYSGPDRSNTHIFTIHEGTKVIIERNQDSWSLIRLKSGAGGWILTDQMEKI